MEKTGGSKKTVKFLETKNFKTTYLNQEVAVTIEFPMEEEAKVATEFTDRLKFMFFKKAGLKAVQGKKHD